MTTELACPSCKGTGKIELPNEYAGQEKDVLKYGGYWTRKCKKCGLTDFDFEEDGIRGGYGAGKNGASIHTKETKPDCRGLVKEIWHDI